MDCCIDIERAAMATLGPAHDILELNELIDAADPMRLGIALD
jgi:hypothetical protein